LEEGRRKSRFPWLAALPKEGSDVPLLYVRRREEEEPRRRGIAQAPK